MNSRMSSDYSVAVFAYNEEKNISSCIASILENSDKRLCKIYVLANGCKDRTVEIVKKLANDHSMLDLIEISEGDKCNAWNVYIHQHAPPNLASHFFVDGDCTFGGNVFSNLSKQLAGSTVANAAAGVPLCGRHRNSYLKLIQERYCLFGNCHALSSNFISRIRDTNFHLPKGLMWIDSAITKAVNSDLVDQHRGYNDRIIHDPQCGYKFESINPFSLNHIKLYYSRLARYQAGKLQEQHLEKIIFRDWPTDLRKINKTILNDIDSGKTRLKPWLKNAVRKMLLKKLNAD